MTTIAEKTVEYNKLAYELGLPTVKRLIRTKEQTVDQRLEDIRQKASIKRLSEPKVTATRARTGTIMEEMIQALIEGATLLDLMLKFESFSSISIRAAINYHIPKKGYIIAKSKDEDGLTRYKITNAKEVSK